jgi:RNase P/RNase MRP subunit POP5
MKALKPSHKENKRYLELAGKDVNVKNIEECILEFIGTLGFANACPKVIKNKNKLILMINHKSLNEVKTSFLLSNKDINVTKVSGVLNKIKE